MSLFKLIDRFVEVYKIETLGALDGPGIRTVIFLQGCPMRCAYCHNADSWRLGVGDGDIMSLKSLYDLALRYKPYYKNGGGVTFSGGEALMQAQALIPLVHELKAAGIHITLDTSGSITDKAAMKLIDAVDLVILDIKATEENFHQSLTGHSMEKPMHVLHHLKKTEKPYWIRQVVLKGHNDTEAHQRLLDALTEHPSREKLEFLPYHNLGMDKWREWQMKYRKEF